MKKTIILTVVLLAACNNKNPGTDEQSQPPIPVINNSGYKVHIDPATGEFLPSAPPKTTPNGQEIPQASSKVQSNKPAQPKVIPSDVPAGGEMIELKGRFLTDEQSIQTPDK